MILAYIFIGLFILLLGFIYYLNKNKNKRINELKDVVNNELIELNYRIGFYDNKYNLTENDDKQHNYDFRVYVTELEKYTNGFSKLKLDKINVINGYNLDKFKSIINIATQEFVETQFTSNITFLEREIDIQKLRKNKLTRILKENKKKRKIKETIN